MVIEMMLLVLFVSLLVLLTERTPRKPLPLGMGRNRGYTRRWFSTYCLTTSNVAPPTVATK